MKKLTCLLLLIISCMAPRTSSALSPFNAGFITSGGAYIAAKVTQQIHDHVPSLQQLIHRDHAGSLVMAGILIPALIKYKNSERPRSQEYKYGFIASLVISICAELYLYRHCDWRTLFPTISSFVK